jgi:hypothetical protein
MVSACGREGGFLEEMAKRDEITEKLHKTLFPKSKNCLN